MRLIKSVLSVSALAAVAAAQAATIFQTGFEAPDYAAPSTLSGVNGWESLDGNPAGLIQTGIVKDGAQALRLSKSSNSNYQGVFISHPGYGSTIQNPVMTLEWDMFVVPDAQSTNFWGVADSYNGLDRIAVGVSGNHKLTMRSGWIGTVETNVSVPTSAWNHFRVDLNYIAGGAGVYLNNSFIGSYNLLPVSSAEHGQIVIFGNSVGNDMIAVDNLSFSGGPVPEPASLAALAVGALAILKRRKRK